MRSECSIRDGEGRVARCPGFLPGLLAFVIAVLSGNVSAGDVDVLGYRLRGTGERVSSLAPNRPPRIYTFDLYLSRRWFVLRVESEGASETLAQQGVADFEYYCSPDTEPFLAAGKRPDAGMPLDMFELVPPLRIRRAFREARGNDSAIEVPANGADIERAVSREWNPAMAHELRALDGQVLSFVSAPEDVSRRVPRYTVEADVDIANASGSQRDTPWNTVYRWVSETASGKGGVRKLEGRITFTSIERLSPSLDYATVLQTTSSDQVRVEVGECFDYEMGTIRKLNEDEIPASFIPPPSVPESDDAGAGISPGALRNWLVSVGGLSLLLLLFLWFRGRRG